MSETKKHRDTLETALAKSELSLNEAQSLRDQGNVLATQAEMELAKADLLARENKQSESQLVRQEAEQLKLKSLEVLRDAHSKEVAAYAALPTEEQLRGIPEQAQAAYRESMKGVSAQYAQAIESLNTAESRVRMARDATVIIGVTVATGGVGSSAAVIAAYGTTGAAGAALVAGTAAGTAIGAAATIGEQGGAVAAGLKDGNHALADGLTQVRKDAQTSLVTSAAMVTGLGVAGKVAPKLGTVITNQVAAKVATGMVSGASGSVVSTTANEAIDVGLNGKEFNGQKFATDLGKNTLAGALGGGIGASGSMMRNGTAVRGSLVTGGEVLADGVVAVGIEGADSALTGREFSMAKAQEAFMQSVQGSVIGELGGKAKGLSTTPNPTRGANSALPSKAEVSNTNATAIDEGPSAIYYIDNYRQQRASHTSIHPDTTRISDAQRQPQVLRMAAGAELMSENPKDAPNKVVYENGSKPAIFKISADQDQHHPRTETPVPEVAKQPIVKPTLEHSVDSRMPKQEEIESFLASEKKRSGSYGDPGLDDLSTKELAQYMESQLQQLGELAPEVMLILRSEKRLGTKIDGLPLGKLLDDPDLLADAVFEARKRYTDSSKGPINPIRSSYPTDPSTMQSFDEVRTAVSNDLAIGDISISERRGRFTGLLLETQNPQLELRYDNPHSIRDGAIIPLNKVRDDHGPGGEMHHIDVTSDNPKLTLRYFKGEDKHIYMFDSDKNQLYQKVEEGGASSWRLVALEHKYRLDD